MSARKPSGRRSTRGALLVISALLVASGLIRLGDGTGLAVAREMGELAEPGAPPPEPALCNDESGIAELLAALQERERNLSAAEDRLASRWRTLELAEEEVTRQIDRLEAAEAKLRATVALADQAAEGDLARLTAVYENMKPKEAATLFEEMAPDFAAGFLGRMRADAAAQIMAGLSPGSAYSISVILAGRNVGVPTE